jgi:mRNA interferase RelE/StbE
MYAIAFHPLALADLKSLDKSVKQRLLKKLEQRTANPRIPGAALAGDLAGAFKVKDSTSGYRLIYCIDDSTSEILVFAVDVRDRNKAYRVAASRIDGLLAALAGDVEEKD